MMDATGKLTLQVREPGSQGWEGMCHPPQEGLASIYLCLPCSVTLVQHIILTCMASLDWKKCSMFLIPTDFNRHNNMPPHYLSGSLNKQAWWCCTEVNGQYLHCCMDLWGVIAAPQPRSQLCPGNCVQASLKGSLVSRNTVILQFHDLHRASSLHATSWKWGLFFRQAACHLSHSKSDQWWIVVFKLLHNSKVCF